MMDFYKYIGPYSLPSPAQHVGKEQLEPIAQSPHVRIGIVL